MNSTVRKRGIAALFCGVASVVLCLLIAVFITTVLKRRGRGSTQYAITAPTISPTESLMPSISAVPTLQPSVTPTFSAMPSSKPTSVPSSQPSLSTSPTSQPSQQPSISSSPSSEPSLNPTISTSPTRQPSSSPSVGPSSAPSTSTIPTTSPSSEPSSIPTQKPKETSTKVIFKTDSSGRSAVAVGGVCFILMACTAFHLRRRQNNSGISDMQSTKNDRSDNHLQYSSDSVVAISSDSVDRAGAAKFRRRVVDDVDLEEGRRDPNSVYNQLMAGNINNIMAVMDMTEAIHVPKMFTRQKEKVSNPDADDKKSVGSVEVTPKACKPVRVISRLSPMFSPMKEFSIKMKERKRRSLTADYQKSRSMACLDLPSTHSCSNVDSEDFASRTSECKSISSIKYEDMQPDEVHDIEEPCEAFAESDDSDAKALSLHHLAEESSSVTTPHQADVSMGSSVQFTYEEELLNSGRYDDGFSFRDVYFDPENELYECRVPTGHCLGISVDSTQLGLRVQKINPTSPLYKIVSAGDVIIGVNDVDVVGLESFVFWELVARRASKHHDCCLVIMKI